MGLTNFLKKKLENTPAKAAKIANTTKQGAGKVFNASQKAINSPKLDTIGRAAKGISYGIETGAGTFNSSLGADDFSLPAKNSLFDMETRNYEKRRPKQKQHKNNNRYETRRVIIIRQEREKIERKHNRHHIRKEPMFGDL